MSSSYFVCSFGRTTDLNENYGLCASYPKVLVVPASVSDAEVEVVSQFRSEQRLPVLCWGREEDSASIWRSSQPKVRRGDTEECSLFSVLAVCYWLKRSKRSKRSMVGSLVGCSATIDEPMVYRYACGTFSVSVVKGSGVVVKCTQQRLVMKRLASCVISFRFRFSSIFPCTLLRVCITSPLRVEPCFDDEPGHDAVDCRFHCI